MTRLLFALLLVLPAMARAELVKEPSTGHAFESSVTVDGRPLTLLGVGVRKRFVIKVYAMGLYVDEAEARRAFPALAQRAGGRDHARLVRSDHAQAFVIWGGFPKMGVLHFVRAVGAERIREAFREGLADELSDKAPADLRAAAEAFLALFDQDLKEGDELILRTGRDGKVDVEVAGVKKPGPQSAKLVRAVWSIWLGQKAISKDLRLGLVDRIDRLARP
jgi:hypothetical protein